MNQKMSWYHWLAMMFKEYMIEVEKKPQYEVVDIRECEITGFTIAVIKLSERHTIEMNISEIVVDNKLIEGFDKQTVRALTYMATVEHLKPDYSIVVQQMTSEIDEFLLHIKSRKDNSIIKKTPSEITQDKSMIAKFNSLEANRIGYLAGIRETTKEYQFNKDKH